MIRRIMPFWVWGIVALFFAMMTMAVSIAFTVYWVHRGFSNECGALNYLIDQGHLTNQRFEMAITRWAIGDGCR